MLGVLDAPRRGVLESGGAADFRSPEHRRRRVEAAAAVERGVDDSGAAAATQQVALGDDVGEATAKLVVIFDLDGMVCGGGEVRWRRRRPRPVAGERGEVGDLWMVLQRSPCFVGICESVHCLAVEWTAGSISGFGRGFSVKTSRA